MAGLFKRKKDKPALAGDTAVPADMSASGTLPALSPDPATNLILADIALRAGSALLRRGVEAGILGKKPGAKTAKAAIKGRSLTQSLVGTALARVATRSVPGAIVIGGGLLAKTLYDRRRGKAGRKNES